MKIRNNFTLDSKFYCTSCGKENIPIARRKGRERESGHLKKLYCLTCKTEKNCVECREFSHYTHEDFLLEFNYGNFTEEGDRKKPYKQFRYTLKCGGVIE